MLPLKGNMGCRERVQSLLAANELSSSQADSLHFLEEVIDLSDRGEMEKLADEISPIQPALIVVDTLARCMGAGDENTARDMGETIRGTGILQSRTGATVLLVHHSGKSKGSGPRGSNALLAAADSVFELTKNADACELKCVKQKDGVAEISWHFLLEPVGASAVLKPASTRVTAAGVAATMKQLLWLLCQPNAIWERGATRQELKELLGISQDYTFNRKLKELEDCGYLDAEGPAKSRNRRFHLTQKAYLDAGLES